jgi:hypothetical protein
VTGDGKLDLICAGYGSTAANIAVLDGNGDGTFQAAVIISLPHTGSDTALTIAAIGDINNDGHPDIIVTDSSNSNVFPLLGDGTGHFVAAPTITGGAYPWLVSLQDLDGDGNLDLVDAGNGNNVFVYLGHGDGTFTQIANYPYSNSVVLGDVDGDGHLDLIGGGNGQLSILHGNSDGTFNANPIVSINYATGTDAKSGDGSYLASYAYLDLNGDGIPDILAAGDDGFTVILGRAGLKFAPPVHYPVGQNFFSGPYLSANTFLDLNGDGHPDFVAAGPGGIYITYGHADGTFASASVYESGSVVGYSTVADFNNDGIPDVVTSGDPQLHLSLGKGDGTFQPASNLSNGGIGISGTGVSEMTAHLAHGDFNGDGNQDILVFGSPSTNQFAMYLLTGHGDGTFDPPVETSLFASDAPYPEPVLFSIVDINKDGRDDVASINGDGTTLTMYLSQPGGGFVPVATQLVNNFTVSVSLPVFDDLNGDGKLDAIYNDGNRVYIANGNGDGSFGTPKTLDIPAIQTAVVQETGPMAVGDFDGDGRLDLAVLIYWQNAADLSAGNYANAPTQLFVYFGQPDGTFSPAVGVPTSSHAFLRLQSADVDLDGRSDLIFDNGGNLYATQGPVIGIMHGLANRTLSAETDYIAGTGLSSLSITDLNDDGFPDIIAANGDFNATANSFTVLMNLGNVPTVTGTLVASPEPSNIGQAFHVTATLASPIPGALLTGGVTFSINGNPLGAAALVNNTATIAGPNTLAAGAYQLKATWPGDGTYPPVNLTGSHVVSASNIVATATSLSASPNPADQGQAVTLSASVTAGASAVSSGTVSFYDGSVLLGMGTLNSSGQATLATSSLAAGTHQLTAVSLATGLFATSTSAVVQEIILPSTPTSTFTLALAPSTLTIASGHQGSVAILLTSVGAFAGPLSLSYGALPTAVSASIQPTTTVTVAAGGNASSTLLLNSYALTSNTSPPAQNSRKWPALAAVFLLPALTAFGKRLNRRHLLGVLLAAALLQIFTGCTNTWHEGNLAAPGTYQLPITATDVNNNSQTATLTIVITP